VTEPTPKSDGPAPDPARPSSWLKLLLAVSLALNLVIVGIAGGAFLRDGPPRGPGSRDLDLGPLADALDRDGRRSLRRAFLERYPDLREGRARLRSDFDALVAALRADPFDPADLDTAVAAIAGLNAERLDVGRDLVADYLRTLDAEARRDFADRLEESLNRRGRRR
jgi:uncharacterized membrane protein